MLSLGMFSPPSVPSPPSGDFGTYGLGEVTVSIHAQRSTTLDKISLALRPLGLLKQ